MNLRTALKEVLDAHKTALAGGVCSCGYDPQGEFGKYQEAHRAHLADVLALAVEQHSMESQSKVAKQDTPAGDPLADAISTACDWMYVTHYVVCAAVFDDAGEPMTLTLRSPGLPLWMQHGLLSYCLSSTVAQPFWDRD